MESLSQFSNAFQVDTYPDEPPTLPLAGEHEHDPESCACDSCRRERLADLDARCEAIHARLATERGSFDAAAVEGDPAAWPTDPRWDAERWEPVEDSRPLADRVAAVATSLKRLDTILGDFLADEMFSLAHNIRRVQATTPIEYEARMEIIDRDVMHECEERGWDNGYAAGLAASL